MTVEIDGLCFMWLYGTGIAMVDFGDGTEIISLPIDEEKGACFSRDYPNSATRTITVCGDNITKLQCPSGLTSLDASNNSELESLLCACNQLTSLDVSKNIALKSLFCEHNELTSLDISKNSALEWLHCYDNQLASLVFGKNSALTDLWCDNNQLTSLDVSKSSALTELSCTRNQLTSLDLSNNKALTDLQCYNNKLSSSALNDMFESLPDSEDEKEIDIVGNPGANDCDKSIAERKKWKFVEE